MKKSKRLETLLDIDLSGLSDEEIERERRGSDWRTGFARAYVKRGPMRVVLECIKKLPEGGEKIMRPVVESQMEAFAQYYKDHIPKGISRQSSERDHALLSTSYEGGLARFADFIRSRAIDNDADFFVQLGRRIARGQKPNPDKFVLPLIKHWSYRMIDGEFSLGLCNFSDDKIRDWLIENKFAIPGLTVDALRKKRQRLGLKKLAPGAL